MSEESVKMATPFRDWTSQAQVSLRRGDPADQSGDHMLLQPGAQPMRERAEDLWHVHRKRFEDMVAVEPHDVQCHGCDEPSDQSPLGRPSVELQPCPILLAMHLFVRICMTTRSRLRQRGHAWQSRIEGEDTAVLKNGPDVQPQPAIQARRHADVGQV